MKFVEKKRLLFFGLPFTFTTYTVAEESITIKKGFLNLVEDSVYMYKIQDVRLVRSLWERIFGLSTVVCYSGDVTEPELKLIHIKNGAEVRDFVSDFSEKQRMKKRTLHTMDIDASDVEPDD